MDLYVINILFSRSAYMHLKLLTIFPIGYNGENVVSSLACSVLTGSLTNMYIITRVGKNFRGV